MPNFKQKRYQMVEEQLKARDITNQRILKAMEKVPREKFVPDNLQSSAYADHPLSIGYNQTISQPYVVAKMCQLLELNGDEKILDIGTGSGYQTAVLSYLAKQVISIEVIPDLAKSARETLKSLNYNNVKVVIGDGRNGAPDFAPFNAIKSAAASKDVPRAWKEQLKIGGRIVLPLKNGLHQNLVRLTKTETGFKKENFGGVMFVPLVEK
jgi:protein-L-isoaspartate(D-aspartate) O-methyltransferase